MSKFFEYHHILSVLYSEMLGSLSVIRCFVAILDSSELEDSHQFCESFYVVVRSKSSFYERDIGYNSKIKKTYITHNYK